MADWGCYRGTDKCLSITGSIFPVSPFLWSFLLSASFSSCIHTFFSFPTLPFMSKKWAEKMSSWCWSKELVLSFFQFLSLPQPPLLAHVSQSAVKRDAFSQQADTKSLGMILPCSCFLPLPAKSASITDFVSARQMIWNVWSLPCGGGGGAGEAKGATPEADAFSQKVVFEQVVSTLRRLCYLNFPLEILNTIHSMGVIDWHESK